MAAIGDSILSDPHQLSWILLIGFGLIATGAFVLSKVRRPKRPYVPYYKQYEIVQEPEEQVPDKD